MTDLSPIHEHNRRAWEARVERGDRFTRPAGDDDFRDPLATVDGLGWLGGDIRGKRLLCLAAGGGKHGPLYAAAGAEVTVLDISPAMLQLDRQVAAERGLRLTTVEASMDDLSMLPEAAFEIVIHPVSTCYVPEIAAVYRQVARVTERGGLYISQHKQPASLQASEPATGGAPDCEHYRLYQPYYRTGPLAPAAASKTREAGTHEFLHRWEELIGGLCRSGFVIEDLAEPNHAEPAAPTGSFGHRSAYLPPYVRIKARRTAAPPLSEDSPPAERNAGGLWLP